MNTSTNVKPFYDIVIIGAGIVGLSAALALSKQGFTIALVEAQRNPKQDYNDELHDTKVVAITRASEHFFNYLNVWSSIVQARSCAYQHMTVWDNVLDGRISFSAVDFFEKNLGHIIEQQVIVSALYKGLKEQQNVDYFFGKTVKHWHYHQGLSTLILDEDVVLMATLIIGADGAKSKMRQLCNIETLTLDYQQTAIVATVKGSETHGDTAYQRFDQDGPLAILPLSDKNLSSIVWTTTPENASRLVNLTANDFAKELMHQINGVMGEMSLVSQRFLFPLATQHAKQYVSEGCALVGDAAHTIHPLAGLGVNLGLLDVASLVEVLSCVKNNKALGELRVLKRYERTRKMHNQIMIWAMTLFKNGFGSELALVQSLRNFGLNWVNKQVSVKQLFAKMALGTLGPIPHLAKKPVQRMNDVKKDAFV